MKISWTNGREKTRKLISYELFSSNENMHELFDICGLVFAWLTVGAYHLHRANNRAYLNGLSRRTWNHNCASRTIPSVKRAGKSIWFTWAHYHWLIRKSAALPGASFYRDYYCVVLTFYLRVANQVLVRSPSSGHFEHRKGLWFLNTHKHLQPASKAVPYVRHTNRISTLKTMRKSSQQMMISNTEYNLANITPSK